MADRTDYNDRNGPETAVVLGMAISHPVPKSGAVFALPAGPVRDTSQPLRDCRRV